MESCVSGSLDGFSSTAVSQRGFPAPLVPTTLPEAWTTGAGKRMVGSAEVPKSPWAAAFNLSFHPDETVPSVETLGKLHWP